MANKSNLAVPENVKETFIAIDKILKERYIHRSAIFQNGKEVEASTIKDMYHDDTEKSYVCEISCNPELTLNEVNQLNVTIQTSFMSYGDSLSIKYNIHEKTLLVLINESYNEFIDAY